MTRETLPAFRNALMPAPTPPSRAPQSMDAARTATAENGASGASARRTDSASRPFEESMSRALRERSGTRSPDATPRERSAERRDTSEDHRLSEDHDRNEPGGEQTADGVDPKPSAASQAEAPTPLADAPAPPPLAWNAAAGLAGGLPPEAAHPLPSSEEAPAGDAAANGASARPAAQESPTGAAGAAIRPGTHAAGAGIAPSSTTPDTDPPVLDTESSTADAQSAHAADGPSATASADALPSARGAEALPRSAADFAAQLAQLRGASVAQPATGTDGTAGPASGSAGPHGVELPISPSDARFAGRFAAEVALLGSAGVERAEIQLQPRELGPVRIELSLSGESARIAFSAVQPETRQAIEQSLPILKDLLAERGLALGQASVSDGRRDGAADGDRASASRGNAAPEDPASSSDRSLPADARRTTSRRTLLDLYV